MSMPKKGVIIAGGLFASLAAAALLYYGTKTGGSSGGGSGGGSGGSPPVATSVSWQVKPETLPVGGGVATVSGTVYDQNGNAFSGYSIDVMVGGTKQTSVSSGSNGKFSASVSFPKNTSTSPDVYKFTLQGA